MEKSEVNLKHLGFVRVLALNTAVLVSNLYDYAKQNSGPLRSTVGTVENAVTTVVRPVYERFKGVPDEVLVFLDKKVSNLHLYLLFSSIIMLSLCILSDDDNLWVGLHVSFLENLVL